MPINSFVDESTYDSHTRSSVDSEVSLIENTNEIKYDGINVEVKYPKFGDALYVENTGDANNLTKHFIDGKSLDTSLLPNSWIPVGVVITNECNKVMIAYYKGYNNNITTNNSNGAVFVLNAITDGTQRSIVFQQYQKTSPYPTVEVGTFTHSCSTQEQFAQELDTWLRANQGGSDINCFDYKWHCDYMLDVDGAMKPHIICDEISNYRQYNSIVKSGATSTSYQSESINVVSNYVRSNKQISNSRVALNYERFLSYLDVSPAPASFEPSSMVGLTDSTIVSRTQFNTNQYCARLRELFSTFEEYVKVFMLLYPTLKSGIGQEQSKSLEWTKRYGNIIYKNLNGDDVIAFPCNYWTQHINFNSDGLRAGDWYLPNVTELYKVIKDVTYGIPNISISNSDQVNKTLNKMNGTLIDCNNQYILCSKKSLFAPWVLSKGSYLSYGFYHYSPQFKVLSITTLEL